MFESEVRVNGNYYKGIIKLWNGDYQFYEEPYIISANDRVWGSQQLREMAKELNEISKKLDSLNAPEVIYRHT